MLSLYGGKEDYIRYFFGEAISRVGGAGPEYRFWNIWGLKVSKPVLARVSPVMHGNTEHVEGTVRFTGRFLAVRCNGSVPFMAVRFLAVRFLRILRFGSVPEPS